MHPSPLAAFVAGGLATLVAVTGCAVPPPAQATPTTSVSASATGRSSTPASTAAATTSPSASPSAKPLTGRTVVIDPGHTGAWTAKWGYHTVPNGRGGTKACNSSGTATNAGYSEHAYNLAQANALATALRAQGATVLMTRTNDRQRSNSLCVNHRADLLNTRHADLLISLHADGNLGKGHRGFHIIVSTAMHGGKAAIASSKALARDLRDALAAGTPMPRSNYIGGGTAFSYRSDLGTLNFAERAAVMIEMGNMRNARDAKLFTSAAFRAQAAIAITAGVVAYLS